VDNWLIGHHQNATRYPCAGAEDPQRRIADEVVPFVPVVGVLYSEPTPLLPGTLQRTGADHLHW